MPRVVQPLQDLLLIEANEVPPLQIRNASFSDESADVSDTDTEVSRERRDINEVRKVGWC